MIKKALLSFTALVFILACSSKNIQDTQRLDFVGVKDKSLSLILLSDDNFDTALMEDAQGRTYHLKNAVTASGTRLVGDKVEIAFKKGEGVVNFGKEDIFIKEIKH